MITISSVILRQRHSFMKDSFGTSNLDYMVCGSSSTNSIDIYKIHNRCYS